jgi:hypothetical protein
MYMEINNKVSVLMIGAFNLESKNFCVFCQVHDAFNNAAFVSPSARNSADIGLTE